MGRMHTGKKGKSGSKKPSVSNATWVSYQSKEVELLITKLAKEGNTPSQIGMILRDSYGIPDVRPLIKKELGEFFKEKGLAHALPNDVSSLIKSVKMLKKHLDLNKHDMNAVRGLLLTEAKIKRLEKYYKRVGVLPASWIYSGKDINAMIE